MTVDALVRVLTALQDEITASSASARAKSDRFERRVASTAARVIRWEKYPAEGAARILALVAGMRATLHLDLFPGERSDPLPTRPLAFVKRQRMGQMFFDDGTPHGFV